MKEISPTKETSPASSPDTPLLDFWHSDDYSEIRITTEGQVEVHFLTPTQAAIIKFIHKQHLAGRVDVPGDRALKEAGSFCDRLSNVFRYSSVWKTVLISSFRRGYYSLAPFVSTTVRK